MSGLMDPMKDFALLYIPKTIMIAGKMICEELQQRYSDHRRRHRRPERHQAFSAVSQLYRFRDEV